MSLDSTLPPAPNRTSGVLQSTDDLDRYRVELVAGQRYFFDLQGEHPLHLALQDGAGRLLVQGVEATANNGELWTSSLSFVAAASGRYVLQAGGYEMWRSPAPVQQAYVLSVGSTAADDHADQVGQASLLAPGESVSGVMDLAQDTDWFRMPVSAGQRVRVSMGAFDEASFTDVDLALRIVAPDGSSWVPQRGSDSTFILSSAIAGDYRFELRFPDGRFVPGDVSHVAYGIATTRLAADDHAELRTAATRLTVGQATSGSLELSGDNDWFRVELTAGQRYRVDLASTNGWPTFELTLTDASGRVLRQTDAARGLLFDAPSTGTYYVQPRGGDYLPEWWQPENYQISVRQVARDDHADSLAGVTALAVGGSATLAFDGGSDVDVFRFEAVAGQRYLARLTGPDGYETADLVFIAPGQAAPAPYADGQVNTRNQTRDWYFTAATSGDTHLAVLPRESRASSGWSVALTAVSADDHSESAASATPLGMGNSRSGHLDGLGDADLFSVTLAAGMHYRAELRSMESSGWFGGFTPTLTVTGPGAGQSATPVAVVTGSHDQHWYSVQFTAPVAGTYLLRPSYLGDYELRIGLLPATAGDEDATQTPGLDASLAFEPVGAVLIGTDADDHLVGGLRGDFLSGGAGRDQLFGNQGDDVLAGGDGNDEIYGASGRDTLDGGAGDDFLAGSEDTDTLNGGEGNDYVGGGPGVDRLDGGAGNDRLSGGEGNDAIDGGAGIDAFMDLSHPTNGTVVRSGAGWLVTDQINGNGADTLVNVERLLFHNGALALDIEGAAGEVARIIGALFGKAVLADHALVGLGLSLRDGGVSYADLVAAAIGIELFWSPTAGTRSHKAFVDIVYRHVVGQAPTPDEAAPFLAWLDSGSMTQAQLAMLACEHPLNAANIGLTGLLQTGLPYDPMG